jgi:hypothetical protein
VLRRKKSFRDGCGTDANGNPRNLWATPWEDLNWVAGFQIQDVSLLKSSPEEYDDPDFGLVGAAPNSQAKKRNIEF